MTHTLADKIPATAADETVRMHGVAIELPSQLYDPGEDTRYELDRELLPRGGEGRSFESTQVGKRGDRARVAIKILTPENYFQGEANPVEVLEDWRALVKTMRGFGHTGFAPVHVAFPIAELPARQAEREQRREPVPPWVALPAFVTTWIDGPSLERWRHEGERPPHENLEIVRPCAVSLDAFHAQHKRVHRDLKPANVIVGVDGARIIDYGLVRSVDQLRGESMLIGTAGYIAPELYERAEYTPATDLYAFAGVLFFLLTGKHPLAAPRRGYVHQTVTEAGQPRAAALLSMALSPAGQPRGRHTTATALLDALVQAVRSPTDVRGVRPVVRRTAPTEGLPPAAFHPEAEKPQRGRALTPLRALALAGVLCLLTVIVLAILANT